ncbi:MAG: DinB family protein [Calditrichaeota bacterium]|nr:MAG: DinB family protein [Calditrichota bacterium]
MKWFDRKFALETPIWLFPNLLERLRGTPLRLEERTRNLSPSICTTKIDEASWSIQENVGHLLDLEELWLGRLDDFENKIETLRAADLQNLKTENSNHNGKDLKEILVDFRKERGELVMRLENLSTEKVFTSVFHPRLKKLMTVVDLCFFIAEHDDHHLAKITAIKKA